MSNARAAREQSPTNVAFLALVFLSELAAWAAIGVAAYLLAGGGWKGWVAAILAVVVAIVAWGLMASPRAKAPAVAGLVTKVVVLGGSVVLLGLVGHPFWAAALGLLIVVAHAGVRVTTPLEATTGEGPRAE
jgi:4-amino-4-deoxy-L-arabinose transferase-like glycosyltransferase